MIKKTLYFGNPAYLSLKHQQLVIKTDIQEITVAVEDIGMVILDHPQITITHGLMRALQDHKALLLSCDKQHMPKGLLLPMEGNTLLNKRQKLQIEASQALKKNLWQQTIKAKVKNQRRLLELLDLPCKRLKVLEKRVLAGDATNIEGQAARYYWKALLGEDFYREQYGDPPNALLNYGYAIIRSMVARALVSSGLLPSLGIFHSNQYNAFSLADDIMEPFRPFVDRLVYTLYQEELTELLDNITKSKLLKVSTFNGVFGNLTRPLMVGVSITTASLVKCFEGSRRKIIFPEFESLV